MKSNNINCTWDDHKKKNLMTPKNKFPDDDNSNNNFQ